MATRTKRAVFGCLVTVLAAAAPGLADNLLITGGTIVNAEGSQRADIRVRGEQIVEVGALEPKDGERVLDATGQLVLPGGVDPHVHLAPIRDIFTFADDFESGSRAALAGGITTVGEMAFPHEGELPIATLERERVLIEAQSIADVFVHTTVVEPSEAAIAGVEALVEAGQPSIKVFMNFETFESQEPGFLRLIERAGALGIRIAIHCEDIHIMAHVVNALEAEGKTSATHYPASRPIFSEEVATQRAMAIAEMTGASLYVVHLSSARALNAVTAVRKRLPVFVETRPIYLHLTEERYRGPDAGLFVGQPPIRGAADQRALWEGIAAGTVDTVATDHAPWTRAEKLDPANTIRHPRPGVNNLQVMLPMLFSEGVAGGKITRERFVAVTSTNAAKLFGLYPRKGAIAPGSDADLAVWDPRETRTIRDADALSRTGFSIYSGTEVTGWPVLTLRRGAIVYENGKVVADAGSGKLISRQPIGRSGAD
ncbi:MAG: amidohydrolase family protein [Myxococcales bacterium]|nr:amidohydrolase family protein [Myxococcales bacterium]